MYSSLPPATVWSTEGLKISEVSHLYPILPAVLFGFMYMLFLICVHKNISGFQAKISVFISVLL